ncbi:hypothetical protein HGRIS_006947 [Hohenbuehelia grisea]|uniref:Cupin type-2 domain-containing protein n=1 Tax=Hohenbuehelia grisea TaxID=104357 RepID=A0ABR3JAI5_9AGAR
MSSTTGIDLSNAPTTIETGVKGVTVTFLRDSPWVARVEGTGETEFEAPLHYHETHDEMFRIIKGRLEYTLGTETKIYTPEDGEISIPRGTLHGVKSLAGEAFIVEEKTTPMDGSKEVFFRNLFSLDGPNSSIVAVMQVYYWGDCYPVMPSGLRWLEKPFTAVLGNWLAPVLGHKLAYDSSKAKKRA